MGIGTLVGAYIGFRSTKSVVHKILSTALVAGIGFRIAFQVKRWHLYDMSLKYEKEAAEFHSDKLLINMLKPKLSCPDALIRDVACNLHDHLQKEDVTDLLLSDEAKPLLFDGSDSLPRDLAELIVSFNSTLGD